MHRNRLALVVDASTQEQVSEHRQRLIDALAALIDVDSGGFELLGVFAANANADDKPPAGECVEALDLLGRPCGRPQSEQHDAESEHQPLGDSGGRRQGHGCV